MALTSTLKAGNLTASTKTFDIDNAKAANMLAWFVDGWAEPMPEGLTQAQQFAWLQEQAHQKLIDYFRAEARRNRARMLREQQQSIDEQAEQETNLP